MSGEMQRRQQRLTVQLLHVMELLQAMQLLQVTRLRMMREEACARSLQAAFATTRAHPLGA